MACNYDQIREEHLRRYGEDVGEYGELLVDLYADRTHFVLELLQNAQDAGATRIRFDLQSDRLEVSHNGRPFDEADVRGICGIRRGTKEDDPEKIGRFGIGFKSVYAFTRSPAIHCGEEHFAIEHYVHPHAIPIIDVDNGWTTLQIIPFDRSDVPADSAVDEIGRCLAEMSPRTILFLRDLRQLQWITPNANGELLREQHDDGDAHRVRLLQGHASAHDAEHWIVFERGVELVVGRPTNAVEIAFLTTRDDDGVERVAVADDTELVAFFPTSRESHLGYLIQAPFIPTPARDNVRERHEVNQRLVEAAAELTVEGLNKLKEHGLLGVGALECLPLQEHHFPPDGLLRPIYDAVRTALRMFPLIPDDGGGYRRAAELRLARGAGLRELFSSTQLGELLGSDTEIHWASPEISSDRTPTLHRCLVGHRPRFSWSRERAVVPLVEGMELDPDAMVRRLHPGYLQRQPAEWMIRLYAWLGGQKAIARDWREHPIVRASSGAHIAAFSDEQQQIWLPPDGETRYPIVDRDIARDEDALGFLKLLGLTEPEAVDEVITSVLPPYNSVIAVPEQYAADLDRIADAMRTSTGEKRQTLIDLLEETTFLIGRNAATGKRQWMIPGELHEPTDSLTAFLDGNPDAWFLADECRAHASTWSELGLHLDFVITRRAPDSHGIVWVRRSVGSHERARDGFDPDLTIHGLGFAVANPTPERSLLVWNLLSRLNAPFEGIVEHSTRKGFDNAQLRTEVSEVGKELAGHRWLLAADGRWCKPSELSIENLDKAFPRDEGLAIRLKMLPSVGQEIAEYLDIEPADLTLLKQNRDLLHSILTEMRASVTGTATDGEANADDAEIGEVDVAEAVYDTFNRYGTAELEDFYGDGEATDPDRRRERGDAVLQDARANEPWAKERWRVSDRKTWEARSPEVREYLRQTYGGQCQICDQVFPRRDGIPYFEARYLVPVPQARWLDTPGNAVCLCPTCFAKLLYGAVSLPDVVDRLRALAARASELTDGATFELTLCGEVVSLRFAQRHLIDLGAVLASDRGTIVEHDGSS